MVKITMALLQCGGPLERAASEPWDGFWHATGNAEKPSTRDLSVFFKQNW